MNIEFKATVRKVGNSSMITIPSEYIDSEIKIGEDYFVTIKIKDKEV